MAETMNQNYLYVGSLITSVIGAALLLFGDFAGWYWWDQYVEVTVWIGIYLDFSPSNLLVTPILLVAVALLAFCAYVSYLGLMDNLEDSFSRFGIFAAIAAIGIQLGVFMIFALINIIEDNAWWPDVGFYGGVIGGALTLTFLYLSNQQKTSFK
ncbi:hypothetical protein CEE45_10770 [Candidatus Heimdallarchaeota archaeon B3_Heim]|nr:MAG: hypothetical protein CEE45_10770 [Candidatus Heimdallarchaeota archaeon B3_Heim]